MSAVTHLLAGVPVSDLDAGIDWYTRFFGRPPDRRVQGGGGLGAPRATRRSAARWVWERSAAANSSASRSTACGRPLKPRREPPDQQGRHARDHGDGASAMAPNVTSISSMVILRGRRECGP
jgi:hypothetical protein